MGKFVLHGFAPLASSFTIWPRAGAWGRGVGMQSLAYWRPHQLCPLSPKGTASDLWIAPFLPPKGRSQMGHLKCSILLNNAGYPSGYGNLLSVKMSPLCCTDALVLTSHFCLVSDTCESPLRGKQCTDAT